MKEKIINCLKENWIKFSSIFLLAIGLFWFLGNNSPKCPEDFSNSEEKVSAFDKWTKNFYEKNPDASIGDLVDARNNYYRENNCTEALKRYNDYIAGDVDSGIKQMIEEIVDEALK